MAARRRTLVKVAAYQAPLLPAGSMDAIALIRARVAWCEEQGIAILCCPEAILGGLADDSDNPRAFAIADRRLETVLAPLASETVTTIVGFTELADDGRLYNAAAVFHRGSVAGIYRKLHPAINRSIYDAGREYPVFRVGSLTFGIVLCNDSNFREPAQRMAARGATALFVPTNAALLPLRGGVEIVAMARDADIARAVENRMWIVRADVSGRIGGLTSHGCSGIVDSSGRIVQEARPLSEDLIVAEVEAETSVSRPDTAGAMLP